MTLGAHISLRCKSHIQHADVVFVSCHPVMEEWITTMNGNVISLQGLYGENKDRRLTYSEMQNQIMQSVRAGKRVVGVFYGHPGVFAKVPHNTIAQARAEGFTAHMEPGISAEDCLYADMGIDPGRYGCQHYEASQFMFYKRVIDTSAHLILWQVALAGDLTISKRVSSTQEREILVELLCHHYPADHAVALYECPTLITDNTRVEWITLKELAQARLNPVTTLVVPPCRRMEPAPNIQARLRQLQ